MITLKQILSLLLVAVLTLGFIGATPKANLTSDNPDFDSTFSDSRVLIVFDRKTSFEFKTYNIDDFPEIDCIKVTDLTIETEKKVKSAIELEEKNKDPEVFAFNKILCLELKNPGRSNILEAISTLKKNEHILSVEPDYAISVTKTPNDPYYGQQWGNVKIDLPAAWDAKTGTSTVVVGVLDTGIDGTHKDLKSRIKTSWCRNFLTGTAASETSPTDPHGHGTHVAGIIGAAGNNSIGVCGVCWNVRLVSLKIFNSNGVGYSSNAIAAISFAESKGIPILNMSGGWKKGMSTYDSPMNTAINNYSGLFVCAAGNDQINIDSPSHYVYPAIYTSRNMIVVGASTNSDTKASFSNYGKTSVDIFAPGENILSTYPASKCAGGTHALGHYANGYHKIDGTSMASPYVAGVAALLKSCHPNLTTSQLKAAIINNGDYCSSLSRYCASGRRLNAFKALDSTHSYSYKDYGNEYYHKCYCSICGYTVYRPHNWKINNSQTRYYCTICGATTSNPISPQKEMSVK